MLLLEFLSIIRWKGVAMLGAETGLMSITQRLFTGGKIRSAAVGSVTRTSGGKEQALCACFGDGRRVCVTIMRSRLRVLSARVRGTTDGPMSPSGGVLRLVVARLSTVGVIMCHGKALETSFFQSV